jgi:hypothetical protein
MIRNRGWGERIPPVLDEDWDNREAILASLLHEIAATGSIARGIDVLPSFHNWTDGRSLDAWMTKEYDVTLVWMGGQMVAHRPDCPMVQAAREADQPLMTMLGCKRELSRGVTRHSCMDTAND